MFNIVEVQVYESYFHMYLNRQIDQQTYESREYHIARRLASPGMNHWWNEYAHNIDPRFIERINARVRSVGALAAMSDVAMFDTSNWS